MDKEKMMKEIVAILEGLSYDELEAYYWAMEHQEGIQILISDAECNFSSLEEVLQKFKTERDTEVGKFVASRIARNRLNKRE